jgi:hypothetical protein
MYDKETWALNRFNQEYDSQKMKLNYPEVLSIKLNAKLHLSTLNWTQKWFTDWYSFFTSMHNLQVKTKFLLIYSRNASERIHSFPKGKFVESDDLGLKFKKQPFKLLTFRWTWYLVPDPSSSTTLRPKDTLSSQM